MKIGIITTSRADFGIYLPLLKRLLTNKSFELFIFAAGTHSSKNHGQTVLNIIKEGFKVNELKRTVIDDTKIGISLSMAKTSKEFAKVWDKYKNIIDIIFALGDRYEMFSAVSSSVPFNIPIAHFHGGENTEGAIDNKFRNAITAISDYHFTSHETHSKRVENITGSKKNIFNIGALGLDNFEDIKLYSPKFFLEKYNFNILNKFILFTYHPETISLGNIKKINTIIEVLKNLPFMVLCTLPNADTESIAIRKALLNFEHNNPDKINCFEDLGQEGYLTAMKFSEFLIGNTSSGIIEAASFNKAVLNLGDRQKGRITNENVVNVKINKIDILKGLKKLKKLKNKTFINPYGSGNSSSKAIAILEEIKEELLN